MSTSTTGTPRTIEHGRRDGFASLSAGRLRADSFPMRLFTKGNAKHWNPASIDFSQDAADFAAMTDDERWQTCALAAQFLAGEESVTQDLQPFVAAMAAEGRLGDEMYLTQFLYEEAKHTQAFRLWFDAVGMTGDLHEFIEHNEHYQEIFTRALPESLYALGDDPSPANQIRASVTYNHVVEGTLALTGYFAWHKICAERGILPGMQKVIKHIGDDERRHMAWGTFTCRRHVAADDSNWDVVSERLNELLPHVMGTVERGDVPSDDPAVQRYELPPGELLEYASNRALRRLGAIESARGVPLAQVDLDASPEQLEEEFGAEDRAVMAKLEA